MDKNKQEHVAIQNLSDIITWSKYAQYMPEKQRRETNDEILTRNMNMHLEKFQGTGIEDEIKQVYHNFVWPKKIVPSMRSLQFAGKAIMREGGSQRIYNCSYAPVTAPDVWREFMLLLLSGVGVGYSVQRRHVNQLPTVKPRNGFEMYTIPDSIEGWALAIDKLIQSFFEGGPVVSFDYSQIRKKGALIHISGGRAPGSEPLKKTLNDITHYVETIIEQRRETQLKPIEVHDTICMVSEAVLSGGIRRSALISLFDNDDEEMLHAKDVNTQWWEFAPYRARANNSAVFHREHSTEKDFNRLWDAVEQSGTGEPGIFWTSDWDWGTNPCGEIGLKPHYDENGNVNGGQFCNLTEINAATVKSQEDFNARARAAAFLGTLQSAYDDLSPLLREGWRKTIEEERLLGVSITGIASGTLDDLDLNEAAVEARRENQRIAKTIGINPAARITTTKPSGTASLYLSGSLKNGQPVYVSSGIHAYHSPYIIRRIRINKQEALYQYLAENQPSMVEDENFDPENTAVISFPIKSPEGAVYRNEAVDDMLSRVHRFNTEWVRQGHVYGKNGHNVSVTISIRHTDEKTKKYRKMKRFLKKTFGVQMDAAKDEWEYVRQWLWDNRHTYGGISVLPMMDAWYPQLPFEDATKEQYEELLDSMNKIDISQVIEEEDHTDLQGELACAGGSCEISYA